VVPLTEDLQKRKKLNGMKGAIIFMVVKVEFADGTVFDNDATFTALEKFFDEYGIIPKEKEEKLSKKR
jgi:hypothetical protein